MFLRFGYSVIASENRILRLCASVAVCNKTSYFCRYINFIRNVYHITFENICHNTGISKTFTMSDSPENDKRGALFIRDLIELRDSMIRNANNDIPI